MPVAAWSMPPRAAALPSPAMSVYLNIGDGGSLCDDGAGYRVATVFVPKARFELA